MASDVFVVGGGIAGLTLARDLAIGGRRVHLIERDERLGGQVAALDAESHRLDAAAESFATRTSAVTDLITELGMQDRIVTPREGPAWIYHENGSASPLPATGLLGVPSSPLARGVRASIGITGVARALADRVLPRSVGADASSFGELVSARMGERVTRELVAPITRGVHSMQPDALAIAQAHPLLPALVRKHGSLGRAVAEVRRLAPAGSAVASLVGGMNTLPIALAESAIDVGVEIHRSTEATDIAADAVTFGGTTHRGDVVMAAAPAGAPTRAITLITLVTSAPSWANAPRGTGVLVAAGAPGVSARALTHVTAKWEWAARAFAGREVVRLSYDGHDPLARSRAGRDATALLGSAPAAVHTVLEKRWSRPTRLAEHERTMRWIGESVAGTGLAAVIAHARRTATDMLTNSTT